MNMPVNRFNKDEFIEAFEDAVRRKGGKGIICPICSNGKWNIPGGYTMSALQNELVGLKIGGPAIPKVPIICNNCGFVAEIAIGVLGLLPKQEAKKATEESPQQDSARKNQ